MTTLSDAKFLAAVAKLWDDPDDPLVLAAFGSFCESSSHEDISNLGVLVLAFLSGDKRPWQAKLVSRLRMGDLLDALAWAPPDSLAGGLCLMLATELGQRTARAKPQRGFIK